MPNTVSFVIYPDNISENANYAAQTISHVNDKQLESGGPLVRALKDIATRFAGTKYEVGFPQSKDGVKALIIRARLSPPVHHKENGTKRKDARASARTMDAIEGQLALAPNVVVAKRGGAAALYKFLSSQP